MRTLIASMTGFGHLRPSQRTTASRGLASEANAAISSEDRKADPMSENVVLEILRGIQTDIVGIHTDIAGLKTDVAELRAGQYSRPDARYSLTRYPDDSRRRQRHRQGRCHRRRSRGQCTMRSIGCGLK